MRSRGRLTRPCATASILLAAREGAAAVVPLGRDFRKPGQRLLHTGGTLAARHVVAGEQQVVRDRELGEDTVALDYVRQSGACGLP